MIKNIVFWILAILITIVTAYYQRRTGPTYPVSGEITAENQTFNWKFYRTHGGEGDQEVSVIIPDSTTGEMRWKYYKSDLPWQTFPMERSGDTLRAFLPHQPPAGKLEYYIELNSGNDIYRLPPEENVVIRFKGAVPISVLIAHILVIFSAMVLANRTGLEFFKKEPKVRKLTLWTIVILAAGGFILGPVMQKYAFGEFWTGFPYGHDLTDNKTLIAMIGWLAAWFMYKRSAKPERWALFASTLMLIVYLIPHSLMGSELDYGEIKNKETIHQADTTIISRDSL